MIRCLASTHGSEPHGEQRSKITCIRYFRSALLRAGVLVLHEIDGPSKALEIIVGIALAEDKLPGVIDCLDVRKSRCVAGLAARDQPSRVHDCTGIERFTVPWVSSPMLVEYERQIGRIADGHVV